MEKALFYKEWYKTRSIFWICLLVALALAAYIYMSLNRIAVGKGNDHLYIIMLLKDQVFCDVLRYFPLIIGLALGCAQMFPEMTQKRLKLTLHLPVSMYKSVGTMLCLGYAELLVIFILQTVCLVFIYAHFVAPELVSRVILTIIPWYAAGLTAYCFTAAICLEGTIRRRVILALIGIVLVSFLFAQPMPEAYNAILWLVILFVVLLPVLGFNSVFRFKEGRQD